MSKANLGWLYYKKMYAKGDDEKHINSTFNELLSSGSKDESLDLLQSFTLTTTYPGLIIGSGYTHGIANDEDSKMGFYFDFTSGVPTIPGSSIKGVLRSLFGYNDKERYKKEKHSFIRQILGKKELDVEKLACEIFDGVKEGKPLGIYQRDKFYEARIIKTAGGILQEDYITPHKEALKNPVPLKIVKVRGGSDFEFSFELHDSEIDGIKVSADEKLALFFTLLQFHGVGAKTNVGYGQFEEKELSKMQEERKLKADAIQEKQQKKAKELDAIKKEKLRQDALQSADTLAKKIEIAIADLQDNKEIYESVSGFEISESDKAEVLAVIEKKIGPKPAPKKKAAVKWAIRVYELLGM